MLRNNWPVDKGIRPAGAQDRCFYCGALKGEEHRDKCTMRTRTVVVAITYELCMAVPEDWDTHMVEFHMNESSSCADNRLDDILKQAERMGCTCGSAEGKYLREATEEDEERFQFRVSERES